MDDFIISFSPANIGYTIVEGWNCKSKTYTLWSKWIQSIYSSSNLVTSVIQHNNVTTYLNVSRFCDGLIFNVYDTDMQCLLMSYWFLMVCMRWAFVGWPISDVISRVELGRCLFRPQVDVVSKVVRYCQVVTAFVGWCWCCALQERLYTVARHLFYLVITSNVCRMCLLPYYNTSSNTGSTCADVTNNISISLSQTII